jgi:membrane associated rhomboid family serine protease
VKISFGNYLEKVMDRKRFILSIVAIGVVGILAVSAYITIGKIATRGEVPAATRAVK